MRFLFEDTKDRYKATLNKMNAQKVEQAGVNWDKALLGFYFPGDVTRAQFSVRDTLIPMLEEDHREQNQHSITSLLQSISLEISAGDAVDKIHDAYTASRPLG